MKRGMLNMTALILGLIFIAPKAWSQDGEGLFKAKCSVCHNLDKNSTGPMLQGVKQKWSDASEGELLYKWVQNPEGLIASGSSKMANAIKDYSPSSMTPQQLSNEEVDAIFTFVDGYVKAEAPTTPPVEGADVPVEVKIVPNYKDNLKLFFFLLGLTVVLLLAIILMASSIMSFVKSDYFKMKMKENANKGGTLTTVIALVGAFSLMVWDNTSHALTFVNSGESGTEPSEWLLVENSDLYLLVVVNIILVGVLIYLRRMFNSFVHMARPELLEKKAKAGKKATTLNKILVDAVPIEEEKNILMDHDYDGIQELDNNLPPWWVWGFYATIIFAVIYIFNYHVFKSSDLQIEAYKKEMAQAEIEVAAYKKKMAMDVDETNATLMTEKSDLDAGKKIFEVNCVTCHNPKGEGNIGPNLTDDHWIYGYDIKEVYKTIKLGAPNGMPEHASKLNPIQIQQISSYVLSLPFAKGKAPEGEIIKKAE